METFNWPLWNIFVWPWTENKTNLSVYPSIYITFSILHISSLSLDLPHAAEFQLSTAPSSLPWDKSKSLIIILQFIINSAIFEKNEMQCK